MIYVHKESPSGHIYSSVMVTGNRIWSNFKGGVDISWKPKNAVTHALGGN
jgi:hypothetical protein